MIVPESDPPQIRTDYNLMDAFLSAAGRTLHGTSTFPYDDTDGYLEFAYKYFDANLIDEEAHAACIEALDYDNHSSWGADLLTEDITNKQWESFYNCITHQRDDLVDVLDLDDRCLNPDGTINPECYVVMRDNAVSECRQQCERNRDVFSRELKRAFFDGGYRIEGDTLTPSGDVMPDSLDIIYIPDFECALEQVIGFCEGNCDLTITWEYDPNDPTRMYAKSVGTVGELEKFAKVFGSRLKLKMAAFDGFGAPICTDTSMTSMPTPLYTKARIRAMTRLLNAGLDDYRARTGDSTTTTENCAYISDSLIPLYFPSYTGCVTCGEPISDSVSGCCPDEYPSSGLFALREGIRGEFFFNSDSCTLNYRRYCTYGGIEYRTEVVICDSICVDSCAVDLCYKWVDTLAFPWVDTLEAPDCSDVLSKELQGELQHQIDSIIAKQKSDFLKEFKEKCGNPHEEFELTKRVDYFHFTLYYYDRAGNLVRTVPPKGVKLLNIDTATRQALTTHGFVTTYKFNSLGQMVEKQTPDGGTSTFVYDNVGRLRFSQDARQAAPSTNKLMSYMKYDALGRIIEGGEVVAPTNKQTTANTQPWFPRIADATADQRVFTYYTKRPQLGDSVPSTWSPAAAYGESIRGTNQRFTLNRVAHVIAAQKGDADSLVETTYSYDPHGNVEWVRQEIPILGRNFVDYEYDLISGNVLGMDYNEGWRDGLYHRYRYDEDNRLIEVKTSRDDEIYDSDARYTYFPHGPLRRAEYGEDSLQGIDYTYTLHGWLKGVNHPQSGIVVGTTGSAARTLDPGQDSLDIHPNYAADAFGMMLRYHQGDFLHNGSSFHSDEGSTSSPDADLNLTASTPIGVTGAIPSDLYNGNISTWTSNTIPAPSTVTGQIDETLTGYQFRYDVLNRLLEARYKYWNFNQWQVGFGGDRFFANYRYDANGNILALKRYNVSQKIDTLAYNYVNNANKLRSVTDLANPTPTVPGDMDGSQSNNNYTYDQSGNLVGDLSENISPGGISWRADGKVAKVLKSSGTPSEIKFSYDASGERVVKKVHNGAHESRLFYVREAGGKVLAVYEQICDVPYSGPNDPALDYDNDGTPDGLDNCPCYYNPSQFDGNNNGIGDECEGLPPDYDGDGWNDQDDNCPCYPNSGQEDQNNDHLGDECAGGCEIRLIELHVYGNGAEGRIAIVKPESVMRTDLRGDTAATVLTSSPLVYTRDSTLTRELKQKTFELKDHLGNVRVVFSDLKLNPSTGQTGDAPFAVDLLSYNNYYPFGMRQPGRYYTASNGIGHRYGFNGKETDSEWNNKGGADSGQGNSYDYGFRIYNPRLGRFLSLDPLSHDFPMLTPYQFASNRPIDGVDIDGLEYVKSTLVTDQFFADIGLQFADDTEKNQWKLDNSISYNGETYYRLGFHVYDDNGTFSRTESGNGNKVTSWVYSPIMLFDISTNHFFGYGDQRLPGGRDPNAGGERWNCADLANAQAEELGTSLKSGVVSLNDAIRVFNDKSDEVLDYEGAVDYINQELEAGRAVVVGVNYEGGKNTDVLGTDHYVTIVGRAQVSFNTSSGSITVGAFLFLDNTTSNANTGGDPSKNVLVPAGSDEKIVGRTAAHNRGYTVTRTQTNDE